ncbi:unnamed protein product [Pleuronectes platessa]|uniref:Uncharacterized protein n=1 Tax=Pleuronectes platessa TaxID=8262 RepID=A0A9N7TZE3_PLEPL|nr:unnamed protein product [Pleuronectes platessa]
MTYLLTCTGFSVPPPELTSLKQHGDNCPHLSRGAVEVQNFLRLTAPLSFSSGLHCSVSEKPLRAFNSRVLTTARNSVGERRRIEEMERSEEKKRGCAPPLLLLPPGTRRQTPTQAVRTVAKQQETQARSGKPEGGGGVRPPSISGQPTSAPSTPTAAHAAPFPASLTVHSFVRLHQYCCPSTDHSLQQQEHRALHIQGSGSGRGIGTGPSQLELGACTTFDKQSAPQRELQQPLLTLSRGVTDSNSPIYL